MELKEEYYGWHLVFQQALVQLIRIDFKLGLVLVDGTDSAELYVETPFRLIGSGTDVLCVPEEPTTLAPILPLVNAAVKGVMIKKSGYISVDFESGLSIKVDPDASYEAWQLGGSMGFLFVCPPGGDVALFKEDSKDGS
jgi:hypothetical protein